MWMNALVSLVPIVLLLILFVALLAIAGKANPKGREARDLETKNIRQMTEEMILPELRGIRLAIEATTTELREARLRSESDLRK